MPAALWQCFVAILLLPYLPAPQLIGQLSSATHTGADEEVKAA